MGMSRDEVEAVLGEKMSFWTESGSYPGGYNGKVGYDHYSFDAQLRLVRAQKNFYHEEEAVAYARDFYDSCTALFGLPKMHKTTSTVEDKTYNEKWYTWEVGDYRIILSQVYYANPDKHAWTTVTIAK
jgi:hypothetical protein